jgi:uncharacterized protein involved in exopolysaccharide biosynthesis
MAEPKPIRPVADSVLPVDRVNDDIRPLKIASVVLRNLPLIIITTLIAFAVAGLRVLNAPFTYTSTASFVANYRRSASSPAASVVAQLGITIPGGDLGQSPAFYVELIKTRELFDRVAEGPYTSADGRQQVDLATRVRLNHLDTLSRMAVLRSRLNGIIGVSESARTGILRISATTTDPLLSKEIAANVLKAVDQFNRDNQRTQAEAERKFTEQRLAEARADLQQAEERMQAFMRANRGFSTFSEANVRREQLSRELMLRQQVATTLAQAYEQARIEEVRDRPQITVIERPELSMSKNPRGRGRKALFGALLGFLFGVVATVTLEFVIPHLSRDRRGVHELAVAHRRFWGDLVRPWRAFTRSRSASSDRSEGES